MGRSDGNKLQNDSEKVGNGNIECEKDDGTDYEDQCSKNDEGGESN
jgi:hypothetical protein